MAMDNTVAVAGNLTKDPMLAYSNQGKPYLRFSIAWNQKRGDTQVANYFDVTAFDTMALNAAKSLRKGMRVSVQGRLDQSSYTAEDGSKRSSVTIIADALGADLRWATADVTKVATSSSNGPVTTNSNDNMEAF